MYMRLFFFAGKYFDNYGRVVSRKTVRNMIKTDMNIKIIDVDLEDESKEGNNNYERLESNRNFISI